MASERERLKDIFEAALALEPEDRGAFLDRECYGDAELRHQVEALLAAHEDGGSFLERPTADARQPLGGAPETFIGPYHLLELIGEGGMGQVWLAEQKQPVRRRVAIKLIKAGMDTREVVARFESERQALALMDHPAISKVFDAGSTPEGRPYFVMEYVAGIPITDYCDRHKLTIRQRMELFIQVCEGVQHAHQKAIIHRDLKPSNILVSEIDGKPMPRIIDFGVAKATSQKLSPGTVYTRVGTLIGTLGYMSPEQADPVKEDVDTRSDVYSLGAVLYELLTGALPLDFKKLAYDEVLRRLHEQDALRPSTKVTTLGEESTVAAKNRASDPPTLVRQLRGDPDAIALKALEKDRARRYASAAELAADICRYLSNEPVSAHPPSTAYRARKYIRRHRLGVAVAVIASVLLVAVAVVQSIELRRITEERDRTARERDRADRIADFMTGMFKVPDPSEARGNTVSAREILDKASKEIDTNLQTDPELQAKMMYTMGDTYFGLGVYSRAQPLLERAVEIQQRVLGPRNPDTLRSRSRLAETLAYNGHSAEAEKMQRETLDIQRHVLGPEHPDTLWSMMFLAEILEWNRQYSEAEKLEREALDIRRRTLGPDHPDTLYAMSTLAQTLLFLDQNPEAEKLAREALDAQRRVLGPEHPHTVGTADELAEILDAEGRHAEAERLDREVLGIQLRVLGPEHPLTVVTMTNLAQELYSQGRYSDAEKLFRQTLDINQRVLGPEHPSTVSAMDSLAFVLAKEQRYGEAEKLQRDVLAIRRRTLGSEHHDTLESLSELADTLAREGHYADAEKLFREVIESATRTNDHPALAEVWYNFACAAATTGRRNVALDYLGHAVDHGFGKPDWIAADVDLKSLHGDPRFDVLVAKARQNTNTQSH